MVILEGPKFSRSNEIFNRQYDPECNNWCISVHIYGASPEKRELHWYVLKGMELNVPIWIGEEEAIQYLTPCSLKWQPTMALGITYGAEDSDGAPRFNEMCRLLSAKDWELVRGFASVDQNRIQEEPRDFR